MSVFEAPKKQFAFERQLFFTALCFWSAGKCQQWSSDLIVLQTATLAIKMFVPLKALEFKCFRSTD